MNNDMNNTDLNQFHLEDLRRMARNQQLLRATAPDSTTHRSLLTMLMSIWQFLFH